MKKTQPHRYAGYAAAVKVDALAGLEARLPGLRTQEGPPLIELAIEPGAPRGGDTPQPDIPDLQFQRMGDEARALREQLLASSAMAVGSTR